MGAMQWFRFYDEALDDPKVQRLPAEAFRRERFLAIQGQPSAFDGLIEGPFTDPERPPAHIWRALRNEVFERDTYTCQYCGAAWVCLECDHIIPVSRGGSHDRENLTTACFRCNRAKRDKTPEEWLS